jgi:hypothetical protein
VISPPRYAGAPGQPMAATYFPMLFGSAILRPHMSGCSSRRAESCVIRLRSCPRRASRCRSGPKDTASRLGANRRPRATETAPGPHSTATCNVFPFGRNGRPPGPFGHARCRATLQSRPCVRCCNMKTATTLL